MKMDEKDTAKIFKALSDEKRLSILKILKNGEICACHLLEDLTLTQSGLSYHMKILTDAGLVKGREVGKWIHYSLNKEGVDYALSFLENIREGM